MKYERVGGGGGGGEKSGSAPSGPFGPLSLNLSPLRESERELSQEGGNYRRYG